IDTTSPGGRLVLHIFGALAEFERELIRERTQAGLAAARARGRKGGRPRKLTPRQVATARTLLKDREHTVTAVAEMLGVSRSTLYRALEEQAVKGGRECVGIDGGKMLARARCTTSTGRWLNASSAARCARERSSTIRPVTVTITTLTTSRCCPTSALT